jgi:hypothetical protein
MNQAQQIEILSEDWDGWSAWVDGRINAALEQHGDVLAEATGLAIGEDSLQASEGISERAGSPHGQTRP